MAWANVTTYNSGTSKTAGTPVTATAVAYDTGDVLFALCACDDINAADAIGTTAVTGGTGLTWTRIGTNQAQSAAGAVAQAVFVAQAASTQTGQTITFTPSSSSAAKVMQIRRFSGGVTATFGSHAINSGTTSPFNCDARTADNGGLVIGFIAREGDTGDTITGDSDTTNGSWSAVGTLGTSGGGAATNVRIDSQYKITTAGGAQTYGPTGTSRDWRGLMINMSSPNATITPSTVVTTSQVGAAVVPSSPPIDATTGEDAYAHLVPFDGTDHRYAALWGRDQNSLSGDRRFRLYGTNSDASLIFPIQAAATGDGAGIGMDSAPGKFSWRQSPTQVGYMHQRYHGGANIGTIYTAALAYNSGSDTMSNGGFGSNTLQPVGVSDGGTNEAIACRLADDKALIVAAQNIDASTMQVRMKAGTLASSTSTSWSWGTVFNVANPASAAEIFTLRAIGFSDTRAVVLTSVTSGSTSKVYGTVIGCTSGTGTTLSTVVAFTALNDEFLRGDWEAFPIDSTRFLLVYGESATDVSTDRRLMCRIVDTTGDAFTLGTELELENDTSTFATQWNAGEYGLAIGDNKMFLDAYRAAPLNPTYGTIASNTMAPGTSMQITKPTSTASGDFLWAFFAIDGDNGSITITPPDGTWEEHTTAISSGNVGLRSFYKQAGGSEAANYTFTFSSSCTAVGSIVRMTGGSAQHTVPWTVANTGASTNPVLGHNIGGNTMLAVSGTDTDVAHTPPSGYTERLDTGAGSTVRLSIASDSNIGTGGSGLAFTASSTNWATLHVPTPSYNSPSVGYIVSVGASGTTVTLDTDAFALFEYDARADTSQHHFPSYLTAVDGVITRSGGVFTPGAGGGTVYDTFNTGFLELPSDESATVPVSTVATTSTISAPTIQTSVAVTTISTASTISIPVPVIPVLAPVASVATRTYIQSGSYLYLPGSDTASWTQVPDSGLDYIDSDLELEAWITVMDGFTHGSVVHLLVAKTNTLAVASGGYYWSITTLGQLGFVWGDGTNTRITNSGGGVLQDFVSVGQKFGIKVTLDDSNGSSVYEVKFWYNLGFGAGWQQLGGTTTGATTASINDTVQAFRMGGDLFGNNAPHQVRMHQMIARNGIGGGDILNIDWGKVPGGTQTFTADTGQTVSRGSATSIIGLVNTGSSVTPPTVATASTVGVPVTRTGATVSAVTVATVSTVGATTISAGARPTPPAVATVSTVGVPTISTGSRVTTTVVATASTVGVPVTQTGATISAVTVATASTVGVPVITRGATPTPPTVATTTAIGSPVVYSNIWDWEDLTTENWVPFNVTLANSSAQAHGGSRSLLATATATATLAVSSPNVPVTAGQTYSVDLWAYRNDADHILQTAITFVQADGSTLVTGGTAQFFTAGWGSVLNGWERTVSCSLVAPPDAVYAYGSLLVYGANNGETFYIDDASVTPITVANVPAATVATTTTISAPAVVSAATPAPAAVATASTVGVPTVRTGSTVTTVTVATVSTVGVPVTRTGVTFTPSAVATVSTVGVPTVRTGSTVTTISVATASQVGVPAFTAPATPAPATVATASQVGVIAFTVPATTAPASVATTSQVGTPTISTGATVTATTVATVSTVGVPATLTATAIPVTTVATTTAIGVPTIVTSVHATVNATTVATATTVGVPALSAGATPAPSTVVTVSTVGVPALQTGVTLAPASVVTVSSVGAPTISTGSTVTTVTVATASQVGTIVFTAPATVAPQTVATSSTVGVPVTQTGATVAAVTVATASTVGAPVVQVGVTPAPANVPTVSTVGAPSLSTGSTVTAVSVQTTTAIGAPVFVSDATVAATTVATTVTIGSPVLQTGATPIPATVATTTTISAPVVSTGATVTPATVETTSQIGAPAVSTAVSIAAVTVATVTTVGTPAVQTQGNATVPATTVATVTTIGAPAFQVGAGPLPVTVATTTTIGTPVVQTSATPTPSTVVTVSTVGAPAVTTGAQPTPAAVPTAVTVGTPTISTGSSVTVTTVATSSSVGVPAVTLGATVTVQTVATASTVGAPVVVAQGNVTVTPPTVATTTQIGAPVTQTGSTVAPQTVATTTSIGAPAIDTATRPTPATVVTTTTIGVPTITRTATALPQTVATVTAIGAPAITAPVLVPVTTVATSTQVGVLVISASSAVVVTTVGTTTQVLPVSISASSAVLVQAIQTQTQVGFAVVKTGFVVVLPVTLQVAFGSRSVVAEIQPRSLTTSVTDRVPAGNVAERSTPTTVEERTVTPEIEEGLTLRRPDE